MMYEIIGKTANLTSIGLWKVRVRIRNAVTEKHNLIVKKELFATVYYMSSNMILRNIKQKSNNVKKSNK